MGSDALAIFGSILCAAFPTECLLFYLFIL
jgi:hypothetical protein